MIIQDFTVSFAFLQEYFGRQVSDAVRDMYWQRLNQFHIDKFKHACSHIMDNFVPTAAAPFPLIKHFLETMGETADTKTEALIAQVKQAALKHGQYASVDFGNRALHAVIQRFGGWQAIVNWGQKDWDINGGRFKEALRTAITMKAEGPKHLPGIIEKENKPDNWTEYIPDPIKIGGAIQKQIEDTDQRLKKTSPPLKVGAVE